SYQDQRDFLSAYSHSYPQILWKGRRQSERSLNLARNHANYFFSKLLTVLGENDYAHMNNGVLLLSGKIQGRLRVYNRLGILLKNKVIIFWCNFKQRVTRPVVTGLMRFIRMLSSVLSTESVHNRRRPHKCWHSASVGNFQFSVSSVSSFPLRNKSSDGCTGSPNDATSPAGTASSQPKRCSSCRQMASSGA